MTDTAEKLYYSISEVSAETGVKAHVLRYWESQFSMLRPRKSRGGVRMYRPKDVELIHLIKDLLYGRGFTIAGARKKLLADRRRAGSVEAAPAGEVQDAPAGQEPIEILKEVRRELSELKSQLAAPPGGRRGPVA